MFLLAIVILFGNTSQASAQTAQDKYLDLAKYETIGKPASGSQWSNYYQYTVDEQNKTAWLTMSVSGANNAQYNANNKWITSTNGNRINRSWEESLPFLGGSKYFIGDQYVYGTVSTTNNAKVEFRVTNVNGVKLLGKNNDKTNTYTPSLTIQVYQHNNTSFSGNGTYVGNAYSEVSGDVVDLSVEGLDETKYYRIVVIAKLSYLYEIAFKTPLELEVTADVEAVNGEKSITNFWQAPRYTHEQTFKVTAKNIKSSVAISSSNPDVFDVSPTTITAAEAKAGKNVIVTFKPQSPNLDDPVQEGSTYNDGQFSATIDIKYNTHLYDQVNVTGKTYHYPVTVSNAKLSTLYYDKPLVIPYESSDGKLLNVEYVKNLNSNENTAEMRSVTQIEKEDASGNLHYIIPDMFGVIIETSEAMTYRFPVYNNYKNEQLTIDGNNLKGLLEDTETKVIKAQYGENAKILTLGKRTGSTDEYGFYKYSGDTMSANKAYLVYESQSGASNDAIFFSIGRSSSENTAIQEVETAIKQMEGGTWYTLQGVRLNDKPTQRGLYLHNGKKIIVK